MQNQRASDYINIIMIHSYIAELETRLCILRDLIGDSPQTCYADIKQAQDKLAEIVGKLSNNKEVQRKCKY